MKPDSDQTLRLRKALSRRTGITEKRMFGGVCFLLRGNMLCTANKGRFMFRVGRALEAEALSRQGATLMVMRGRKMRGFVRVSAAGARGAALKRWVDLASRYVGTLPAK